MSDQHTFEVIVVGGGHAGRSGAVVDCLEWQSTPLSAQAFGLGRVSPRGLVGRVDETSVPVLIGAREQ